MSCPYYTFKSSFFGGDYWCNATNQSVNEDIYYKFCRNYDYDGCNIYKKNTAPGGCYLTTVVCGILKKDDNDKALNTLRSFRDNVMQKNEDYKEKLLDYDNVGPIIADCMMRDSDRLKLANFLYDKIILDVASDIENKKYDDAVLKYEVMTLSLINYYGLKHWYNDNRKDNYGVKDFNPELSGHGVRVKK